MIPNNARLMVTSGSRYIMHPMTLLVAIAAAVLAQTPGQKPVRAPATTTQRAADPNVNVWLARAERDVRAVVAAPMPDPPKHFGHKIDLALALVQTRGNEADKKLLRDALAQPLPPLGKKESPEVREMGIHYLRSVAHAALGETDAARAEARALDEAIDNLTNNHPGRLF